MNQRQWGIFLFLILSGSVASAAGPFKHSPPRRSVSTLSATPRRAEDHVIVKFKSETTVERRRAALATYGSREQKVIRAIDTRRLSVPAGQTPETFIDRLLAEQGDQIEYAHIDRIQFPSKIPNDYYYSYQYHLPLTHCPEAWDSVSGSGIIIAIGDTGVNPHSDLSAHMLPGMNVVDGGADVTDTVGHGTAVAGTAAAIGDNSIGVAGVAYNATILPIKVSNLPDGSAYESDLAEAIVYAADAGAKVVNESYGGDHCESPTLIEAAAYLRSKGGLFVKAAGNETTDKGCSDNPEIISVSATDPDDQMAYFSNFGDDVDVAAPGVFIVTTDMDGTYVAVDGTSFSSPLTAGILALIFSVDPSFTPDQAQQILFDSADDLGAPGKDKYYGWGRVNAGRVVGLAMQRSETFRLNALTNVYAYPNPWDIRRHTNRQMTFENIPDNASAKIFTLSGFWVKNLTPSNGRATWDLTNSAGDRVASGLYFYLIQSSDGEHKARGTVAIIK